MADTSCASSSAVGAEVVGESTAQQSSQMPGFISPVYGRLSSMNSQNASNANMSVMRTVFWDAAAGGVLKMINQPALPAAVEFVECHTVKDVANAIKTMIVRGAPAIGATGAYGMAIAARGSEGDEGGHMLERMKRAKVLLDAARPTAVNLSWATRRMLAFAELIVSHQIVQTDAEATELILKEAANLSYEDIQINCRMAQHGALVIPDNANILHHCNTGVLATVDVGTDLGLIYESHYKDKNFHVWVDETRPRLQGARLTAWELQQAGVPYHLICDNASGSLMRAGKIDVVIFGADRVAANGDVVNKIGTYNISVLAKVNNVPVYAVVPTSTIDLSIAKGDDVVIEERDPEEVANVMGKVRIAPEGANVYNPAFDCTPHEFLSGIITEEGICYPPFSVSLQRAKQVAETRIHSMWNHRVELALQAKKAARDNLAAEAMQALK